MKDELISYATSKLAKEKGFDQKLTELGFTIGGFDCVDFPLDLINGKDVFASPTQALLQRWLREVHSIKVDSNWVYAKDYKTAIWYYSVKGICLIDNNVIPHDENKYETYELALEAGLKEALKTLK